METLEDRLKQMVKTFRRECHRVLPSERTTVHGADGMLMVLQLAMAEVNKQLGREFKVALSDVLMAWKHLLLEKLHLPPPGFARPESYDLMREAYEAFLKRSNTVDLLDVASMYGQLRVADLDPEEPVSQIQLFDFLLGNTAVPAPPCTPSRKPCSSQVKTAVRRVFCSYLSLLVNSKNDMALALTLDVPDRSLGRQAFADIRHAARDDSTALFLAVTSFVRAVQLGGRGYAPAESDPLRKYLKGLSEFVQFLDSLEEILGEIPDPSVCGARLVAAIRAVLVKGRGGADQVYAAAGETAAELTERICQLHQIQKQAANGSATGISPARPKAYAVNHATAFGGRDTVKVLIALLDEEAVRPPWPNKADLLCEDQPVLGGAEASCVLTLFRSPEVSTGSSPEPLRNRVQSRAALLRPKTKERVIRSQFACTYVDQDPPLSRVLDFPSTSQAPTCVHPARRPSTPDVDEAMSAEPSSGSPDEEVQRGAALQQRSGNDPGRGAGQGNKKTQGSKRKQLDSESEPRPKKQVLKVPGKTVGKKKLIAGQGKLTSFFRV
ncbi:PCNA-interacting partner [Salarias fasciatus]|uniref:PCNA-interacting partner n=1 Tax=Salarias fasciatus TaxID=181472 RepID=UPI001176E977|nr:PCNA-interacting partner [Salarias fasciatus]